MSQPQEEADSSQIKASAILSPELRAFYESHNVNVDAILHPTEQDDGSARFVRLNPRFDASDTLSRLGEEVSQQQHQGDASSSCKEKYKPKPVLWLGCGFYAIPATTKLQKLNCFRSGRVYGMDVSSGAAVAVLMTSDFDSNKKEETKTTALQRVLDICCAPGLKLCMLADMLPGDGKSDAHTKRVVVGVDLSEPRLALCKKIVKKYHVDLQTSSSDQDNTPSATIRIYHGNGVTFGRINKEEGIDKLIFDSKVSKEEAGSCGKRKRMNRSARVREQKRLKQLVIDEQQQLDSHKYAPTGKTDPSLLLFDRVLVDAECSTDGSLKHVQQQVKKLMQQRANNANAAENHDPTSNTIIENHQLTDKEQLKDLVELQRGLLASGYRNLKQGGLLVYSTCSLSTAQNEGVVQWLLDGEKDAFLIPLEFRQSAGKSDDALNQPDFIREGSVKGTIRFVPSSGDASFSGGGFFVAKIGKKQPAS